MNIKTRLFAMLMAFVLIVGMLLAQVSAAPAENDDAVQVKKSGGSDNFAADAPISTVRLDRSKFTKENAKLTASGNLNVDGYELAADGTVWAISCKIDADYKNIGGFTLAFPDAAILPDGTRKPVEVVFHDVHVITKSGAKEYKDNICVAGITGNPNGPIAFSPLSSKEIHMALRADVTFKVNGVNEKDVFLFDARHINNVRLDASQFASIVNASSHYNYSESMEPASGVVAGSHLYLPANSALRVETGRSSPTLGHRFVCSGTQNIGFNHGFAAAAQAKNGFQSRVWSSAGTNHDPLEIFFLCGGLTHDLIASSGDGGTIELWSDGLVDSASAQNLPGGTLVTPYAYDVPNGKPVTLKMMPKSGYELNKLYVNGEETAAAEFADSAGNVTHYTYTFDADQTGEQRISVTWRALPITDASVWWKYDADTKTLYISDTDRGGYAHFHEAAQIAVKEGSLPPWGMYLTDVETAVIEGKPAPVSTACWFFGMEKLLEIQNLKALNTSNVTDMSLMFIGCQSLAAPELSGFVTSKVTNMSGMFQSCISFSALDLSSFDVSAVKDMSQMFAFSEIATIYVAPAADWTAAGDENDAVFTSCRNLVGGNGTSFLQEFDRYGLDRAGSGKYYARVDGLNGEKGYFTEVSYGIELTPQSLDLGSAAYSYSAPAAQPVAVSNTGNQSVTFDIDPFMPRYFDLIPCGTLSASENALQASGNPLFPSTTVSFQLKPKANLAPGTYSETITLTWQGGKNETGTESVTVTFEVEKVPLTLSLSIEGWAYGETAKTPALTGNTGNGAVTYEYKLKTADEAAYSTAVPTAAGEYTVRATVAETANYLSGETTADFTISVAPVPIAITYEVKDSSGNTAQSVTWQKSSDKTLDLTIKRSEDDNLTYGKFVSLEMDGNTVGSGNYGTAEGSLKLSVKPEYLETLSVGDYIVKVNFQDGSATVKLTVKAAATQPTPKPDETPTSPKTGDESNPARWSCIMFLSVAGMIVLLLYTRKRITEK